VEIRDKILRMPAKLPEELFHIEARLDLAFPASIIMPSDLELFRLRLTIPNGLTYRGQRLTVQIEGQRLTVQIEGELYT